MLECFLAGSSAGVPDLARRLAGAQLVPNARSYLKTIRLKTLFMVILTIISPGHGRSQ